MNRHQYGLFHGNVRGFNLGLLVGKWDGGLDGVNYDGTNMLTDIAHGDS